MLNLSKLPYPIDKKSIYKIVSEQLKETSGVKLKILNHILPFMLPFNAPHKPTVVQWNTFFVDVALPFQRKNLNHLNSIHACAIALLGEFTAGLILLKNFDYYEYRLIMANLNVEYLYQAKTDLMGHCQIILNDMDKIRSELQQNHKSTIELTTEIKDINKNIIARVKTQWQLKSWEKVKTSA